MRQLKVVAMLLGRLEPVQAKFVYRIAHVCDPEATEPLFRLDNSDQAVIESLLPTQLLPTLVITRSGFYQEFFFSPET